jgi:hypothetical protein
LPNFVQSLSGCSWYPFCACHHHHPLVLHIAIQSVRITWWSTTKHTATIARIHTCSRNVRQDRIAIWMRWTSPYKIRGFALIYNLPARTNTKHAPAEAIETCISTTGVRACVCADGWPPWCLPSDLLDIPARTENHCWLDFQYPKFDSFPSRGIESTNTDRWH